MGCCASASNRPPLPAEPRTRSTEPFLRFQEVIDENEVENFEKVVNFMERGITQVAKAKLPDGQEGKHIGSQEGATLAVFHGTFEVTQEGIDKLPPELRLGPWAKPRTYDTVCRFNYTDKSLRISMKFDYEWDRADKYSTSYGGDSGYYGMDILYSATYVEGDNTLSFADAYDMVELQSFVHGGLLTKLYYLFFQTNSLLRILGLSSQNRKQYDAHAVSTSPLDVTYNSKMASACGPAAVKYSLTSSRKLGVPGEPRPKGAMDHMLSRANLKKEIAEAKEGEFNFDFRIQVANAQCCAGPIRAVEDPTQLWNETLSVPIVMGKLRLRTGTPDKEMFALAPDEDAATMKFSPWNAPPEHRPLGSVGRCRRYVYHRHAKERIKEFGLAPVKCPFAHLA